MRIHTTTCVQLQHFSLYQKHSLHSILPDVWKRTTYFYFNELPEVNNGQTPDVRAQIAEVDQRLHFAHEDARKNLERHREAMKTYYDKDCRTHEYAVGDRVWVFFPHIQSKGPKKFYSAYSRPYTIIEKIGQVNFKLLRTHDLQPLRNIIHVNRMKPYVHRQLVPPEPDDYEDLKDYQPVHVTELHPLDQGKVQETAGEDQLEENNETQIDVVNLDGEIPADMQTNSERPQNSEDHQNPPNHLRVTRIQTKGRKQDRSKD